MSELVSLDAEMAVIGSILVEPERIVDIVDWLPVEAFGDRQAAFCYRAILRLWERRAPANLPAALAEVMAMGARSESAASQFLRDCGLAMTGYSAFYVGHYAELVLEFARRRAIEQGALDVIKAVHGDPAELNLDALLVNVRVEAKRFDRAAAGPMTMADHMAAWQGKVVQRWDGELVESIVPTGITMLDRMLNGGLRPAELLVLAARPSMGKSSLMTAMAMGKRSLIFSLEMTREVVLNRLAAGLAQVPYGVVVNRVGDVAQQERVLQASEAIGQSDLLIVEEARTTAAIVAMVEERQRTGGVDAVYIDHLDWLEDTFRKGASDYERISALSRRCKDGAKQTGVPWVVLSQLNREVEHRTGCVPYMSDLRESGKLEQDADHVLLMYRRAYYSSRNMGNLKPDMSADYITGHPAWERLTLNLTKNRNGQTGIVDAGWDGRSMRVHDLEGVLAA